MLTLVHGPLGGLLWLLAGAVGGGAAALVTRARGGDVGLAASAGAALLAAGLALGLLAPAVGPALILLAFVAPPGGWLPADLVVAGALLGVFVHPLLALVVPRTTPLQVPAAARWAGAAAALAVPVFAWPALVQQALAVPVPGLLAMLPGALIGVALAKVAAPSSAAIEAQAAPAPRALPAPALTSWKATGAVPAEAAPFLHLPAATGGDPGPLDAAWSALGAAAPAPPTLAELDALPAGASALLADLPGVTTTLALSALTARALQRGERVLLIHRGGLQPGPWESLLPADRDATRLVHGADALRAALAADRLPAVTALSIADLASDASLLHPQPDDATRAWLATLGLVLLPEVDHGGPLPLTHRMHTLRRVHLALARAGASFRVVATGASGGEALRLLQHALPGLPARAVALDPPARPEITVWLCDWRFIAAGPEPWVTRAARAGGPVHISDPLHQVAPEWLGGARTSDAVMLDGSAGIAWMSASGVAEHAHAMRRVAAAREGAHQALWALRDDPVTRFLGTGDHLVTLLARGRLAPPQGVFGVHNRGMAREHLRRALSDGPQAVALLRDAFGPSLVDEVVGAEAASWRALRGPDGKLVRTPVVAVRPAAERPLVTDAVTDRTTDLIDAASGLLLATLDELTAPVRMYPRRVLQLGAARYEVPLHAHDQRRARIEIRRVEPDAPLTLPLLTTTAEPRELSAAPESVQRGPMSFRLGTFEVIVEERVAGVLRADRTEVRYPEVSARYRTRARLIAIDRRSSPTALTHLAASLAGVLEAHLRVGADDLLAIAVPAGWWAGWPAGVLIIDRNIQGAGVAEALDATRVALALEWVFAILHRCPCERGCASCSPASVLATGDIDKAGVLAALGG